MRGCFEEVFEKYIFYGDLLSITAFSCFYSNLIVYPLRHIIYCSTPLPSSAKKYKFLRLIVFKVDENSCSASPKVLTKKHEQVGYYINSAKFQVQRQVQTIN